MLSPEPNAIIWEQKLNYILFVNQLYKYVSTLRVFFPESLYYITCKLCIIKMICSNLPFYKFKEIYGTRVIKKKNYYYLYNNYYVLVQGRPKMSAQGVNFVGVP